MKTVHVCNIIFHCTKQENKLNHILLVIILCFQVLQEMFSDNEKNPILILSHALGAENENRIVKMFSCKVNSQGAEK